MSGVPQRTGTARPPAPRASDNWRGPLAAIWLTVFAFFGFGGAWAFTARLDKAAVAPGIVASASNRKTIQHFEGGIVREIFVRDGDLVAEGQVLVRLEPTMARASAEVSRSQLAVSLAQEARLNAERDEAPALRFPPEVLEQAGDPLVARAIADQEAQFRDRRGSLQGQVAILESRIRQLDEAAAGLERQRVATLDQLRKINEELVGLKTLAEKKLIPVTRVFAMEREKARLDGELGRVEAEIARGEQAIGETRLQIQQTRRQFLEGVGKDLVEVRRAITEGRERMTVASDVLRRVDIRAPHAGVVQALKVFTVGGVVKPGDTLMELAPTTEDLVIRAQVSPNDIDAIRVGDRAELVFPAFMSRKPPMFWGTVRALSRDRLTDDATRQPYFAAEVVADPATIPAYYRERIIAGMQADAVIATGERTAIEYLIGPLRERLKKSMVEH